MAHYVLKEHLGLHNWREVARFEGGAADITRIIRESGVKLPVIEEIHEPFVAEAIPEPEVETPPVLDPEPELEPAPRKPQAQRKSK